ncbi:hypothetical protein DPMN_116151 [Dreissena polymorpha]|uniref:Uncharacterized protein n=1 Tax=Dreissena polymorpha TaxID=45954 RepID=A0A9D4KNB6_DREPO|nr:hypothetical protein DPMN_104617 [Dreissena polymorpha]KAH3842649.1 hypothetical protein DPMN_116151 [Dreissena polymorpha]
MPAIKVVSAMCLVSFMMLFGECNGAQCCTSYTGRFGLQHSAKLCSTYCCTDLTVSTYKTCFRMQQEWFPHRKGPKIAVEHGSKITYTFR